MANGFVIPVHVAFRPADNSPEIVRCYHFSHMSSARHFANQIRDIPGVLEIEIDSLHAIHSHITAFELFTAERI